MSFSTGKSSCESDQSAWKKRRLSYEDNNDMGFTNEGFASTPKNEAKNVNQKFRDVCNKDNSSLKRTLPKGVHFQLEEKSIAEILMSDNEKQENQNPYEIIRRPPKKKKRSDVENACFENAALNLNGPDSKFNPFEVKRTPVTEKDTGCFVNPGLNIRMPENDMSINPYEISREAFTKSPQNGIENPAMEISKPLKIGIPFQPTVGCRIDFSSMSVEGLNTPSKMFAEKLVFSPPTLKELNKIHGQPLSVIIEEPVDIGTELDHYQLELENSINEAKIRKGKNDVECDQHLPGIKEEFISSTSEHTSNTDARISTGSNNISADIPIENIDEIPTPKIDVDENCAGHENTKEQDLNYDDDNDDDKENGPTPAPFVRSYRGKDNVPIKTVHPKNHLKFNEDANDKNTKVTGSLRKSIKKLVRFKDKYDTPDQITKPEHVQNIFGAIRQSLNRKCKVVKTIPEEENNKNDQSILDNTERKIYRSTSIQENSNENLKNHFFRTSLRKSTKTVRNKVLKNVFHKKIEAYDMMN